MYVMFSGFIYNRPGNLVQFRAVVVDQRLKPSVVGSIDVSMNDGNGNLIKKWDRVFTTKGNWYVSAALDHRRIFLCISQSHLILLNLNFTVLPFTYNFYTSISYIILYFKILMSCAQGRTLTKHSSVIKTRRKDIKLWKYLHEWNIYYTYYIKFSMFRTVECHDI